MSRILNSAPFGANLALAYTDNEFGLMTQVQADSGVYIFGQADGAIGEGALCKFTSAGQFDTVTTAESGSTNTRIGVCVTSGGLADNEYGWFWLGCGNEEVLLATSISANAQVTTTTTAGTGGAGGDNVDGLFANESSGSGGLTNCRAAGFLSTNMTVAAA